jgi:hypothetical protein
MKKLFSLIASWFAPKKYEPSEVDLLRLEYHSRVQSLEHDVRRLCTMLSHDQMSVTTDPAILKEHFKTVVREAVEESFDFNTLVSDAITDHDFSDSISDALDDAISNRDWDYELRQAIDWDKVADKVADKIEWSDVISDNDIITRDELDPSDVMLQSEHMSDDDLVTRADLSDMVGDELKRDWFTTKLQEDIARIFKDTLYAARQTEEDNCRNAIDDAIEAKLDLLLVEQMKSKFGPQFDIWFHNLVAHAVKTVLGEMVKAAYEEVTNAEGNNNA